MSQEELARMDGHGLQHLLNLSDETFTYDYLRSAFRKALRAGKFGRLSQGEKALYKCALWIAKNRGQLRNLELMAHVASIVAKFLSTFKAQAFEAGRKRAESLIRAQDIRSIQKWAPEVLEWVNERKFVLYLGILVMNGTVR